MSRAGRITWIAVGTVILAVTVGVLVRDVFLKAMLVRSAREVLRGEIQLDRMRTGIFPPSVRLTGLSIENPDGYPRGTAINVGEFYMRIRPGAFRGPTNEITEIRLIVPEASIISTKDGRNNFVDLVKSSPPSAPPEQMPSPGSAEIPTESTVPREMESPETTESSKPPGVQQHIRDQMNRIAGSKPIRIGTLTLGIGVIHVRSERGEGKEPRTQVIEINGEHTLTDVTDLEDAQRELGSFMLMRALPSLLQNAMEDH